MSEKKLDYAGSAIGNLQNLHDGKAATNAESALVVASVAQTYATLALVEAQQKANEVAERAVEQQRIANEITRAIKEQNDGFAQQVAEVTEIARSGWENYNRLAQHIAEQGS